MNKIKTQFINWINDREDAYHFKVSLAKSALRFLAGASLVAGAFTIAGIFIIAAEVFGVIEEL
jgi:hypothetical protein